MSRDPIGFELINPKRKAFAIIESNNSYSYVANNPVKFIDPSGLKIISTDVLFNRLYLGGPFFYQEDYTKMDYLGNSSSSSGISIYTHGCLITALSRSINSLSYNYFQPDGMSNGLDFMGTNVTPDQINSDKDWFGSNSGIFKTWKVDKYFNNLINLGFTYKKFDMKDSKGMNEMLKQIKKSPDAYSIIIELKVGKSGSHFVNGDKYNNDGTITINDTSKLYKKNEERQRNISVDKDVIRSIRVIKMKESVE